MCSGVHTCGAGFPGLVKVTVQTSACSDCGSEKVEVGLQLTLNSADSDLSCTTNGLDNEEKVDYTSGTADFLAEEDDGLGGCEYVSLFSNIDFRVINSNT